MPRSCKDTIIAAHHDEEDVDYTNLQRTSVDANGDLNTTSSQSLNQGWLSGASSVQTVNDDDYIEFEIENISTYNNNFLVGLSFQDNSTNLYESAYGFFVRNNGSVSIHLGSSTAVYTTSRSVGDKFRIERDNGTIRFKKNGVTIYSTTDTQQSTAMYADVSMWFQTGYVNRVYNLVVGKFVPETTKNVCYGNWQDASFGKYRYAYNGMETDSEVSGTGNSYTTQFRQYDPRLGRWKSLDPIYHPHLSPYNGMDNNPILISDPDGDDGIVSITEENGKKVITISSNIYLLGDQLSDDVMTQLVIRSEMLFGKDYEATVDGQEYIVRFNINFKEASEGNKAVQDFQKNFSQSPSEKIALKADHVKNGRVDLPSAANGNGLEVGDNYMVNANWDGNISGAQNENSKVKLKTYGDAREQAYTILHEALHLLGLDDRYGCEPDDDGGYDLFAAPGFSWSIMSQYHPWKGDLGYEITDSQIEDVINGVNQLLISNPLNQFGGYFYLKRFLSLGNMLDDVDPDKKDLINDDCIDHGHDNGRPSPPKF